jgi:hypothetical protein
LAALVLAAGCASSSDLGVHDPSVPAAQLCVLEIGPAFTVVSFNGQEVFWRLENSGAGPASYARIRLPPGQHELLVNFYRRDQEHRERLTRIRVNGEFSPGGVYRLEHRPGPEGGRSPLMISPAAP